jgi:hypothetical protein
MLPVWKNDDESARGQLAHFSAIARHHWIAQFWWMHGFHE